MHRNLSIQAFLREALNNREFGAQLHWENRPGEIWRLLYYHNQKEKAVFQAWNDNRPRRVQRHASVKSLFHQTLRYMANNNLIEELEREERYRRFQFIPGEIARLRRRPREIIDNPNINIIIYNIIENNNLFHQDIPQEDNFLLEDINRELQNIMDLDDLDLGDFNEILFD